MGGFSLLAPIAQSEEQGPSKPKGRRFEPYLVRYLTLFFLKGKAHARRTDIARLLSLHLLFCNRRDPLLPI